MPRGQVESKSDLSMKTKTHFAFRVGSLVRPCHLDRDALSARPEVACRYRTGRVALRETARLKIVPQVRQEGKGVPARQPGSRGAPAVSGPSPLPCRAERRRRRHRGLARRLRHAKYAAAWNSPVHTSSARRRSGCGMHLLLRCRESRIEYRLA
jgi:hypothetical protein